MRYLNTDIYHPLGHHLPPPVLTDDVLGVQEVQLVVLQDLLQLVIHTVDLKYTEGTVQTITSRPSSYIYTLIFISSFSRTISSFSSSNRCRSCFRDLCFSCSSSILPIRTSRDSLLRLLLLSSDSEDFRLIFFPVLLILSRNIEMSALVSSNCCL